MKKEYILEWLDTLITVTLNPENTQVAAIRPEDLRKLRESISYEKARVTGAIKHLAFSTANEVEIRFFIKLYHSGLVILLDQAIKNQKMNATFPALQQISDEIVLCVDELILFMERRFANYLGSFERLPATYLSRIKNELNVRLGVIGSKLESRPEFKPAADILLRVLGNFLDQEPDEHEFTFHEISYLKELCLEIESLEFFPDKSNFFSVLDERLIYMNFNDRLYADSLFHRLKKEIESYETTEDRLENLLLHAKVFRQLRRKPGVIFSNKHPSLVKVLLNWFRHEISYQEKKIRMGSTGFEKPSHKTVPAKPKQKVVCALSTDQTGLILRAADELRILVAKSMSEVFKTIVPHLSTPYKEDLSYDGMRSKAYVAEEKDKQKAIDALKRIIRKIEEY